MLARLIRDLFRAPAGAGAAAADPGAAVVERAARALDGAPEEAERLCRELLRDLPEHVEARVTLGAAQLQRGAAAAAVETLREALRAAPRHGEGQLLLGRALRAAGDVDAAVLALQRAQRLIPERSDFWNEFGLLQLQLGNLDAAWVNFDRAAALNAHQAQAWINLAVVAQRQGLYAKALACLERAVEAEPDSGLAWSNYGLALRDNDRLEEAIPALRRAAELRPAHPTTRVNLASVLLDNEQYAEARVQAEHALTLKPDFPEAHVVLAGLHARNGEFGRATEAYERALQVAPDSAVARAGLGELQLLQRDFARGWDNYEHRFGLADAVAPRLPFPRWDGAALGQGRLLVRSEQGIGDMILFASCVPDALQRAPRLVLEAPEKLAPLFARSFPGAEVRAAAHGYPPWLGEFGDVIAAIPAGSLMGCFRRNAADFPDRPAYLRADPARVARWRERLTALGPGPKLGLAWGGGFYRTGRKGRTIAPEDLEPLLGHSEVHFVSLQYTPGAADEAAELGARRGRPVHHWPEAIADYEETAALVAALDLVVTVCTAAAHLSGALGQRVWILAPESASWRYLGAGEDLPWYPAARVFRRAPGGTWRTVVERVADALGADLGLIERAAGRGPEREAGPAAVPPRAADADPRASPTPAAIDASHEDPRLRRAGALWTRGEREAAIESLESSLATDPAWADGWHEAGRLYAALNRLGEARDCLELALHHDPRHLGALELLAKLSDSSTAYALAAGYLARACAVAPHRPDFRVRLAKAQYLLGAFGEARESARAAIALDPGSVEAHVVLGVALIGMEDFAAAVDPLESAVRLAPGIVSGHLNLGNAYLHAGRFAEAKERLRWVITHEPNNFIARWDYAHLKLASREFEEGWSHYEFRKQAIHVAGKTLSLPEWRGQPLADGSGLVILREQGLGDEIMFASCMPDVLSRVRDCVLQCDARLAKLFARSFPGVRTVVGDAVRTALGQAARYEVSAGTLPVLFRRSEHAFPAHRGYLRADAARVADWRRRLAALGPGLKLGLSWRGGSAHTRTKLRSIPLADLAPVLRVPGCHFVSLQYGAVEEDIATLAGEPGLEVVHFPEAIADYDETAALVSALDVVVTVCTSIVHLTGALGRPVWVLVPSIPEWRYCFDGETLPWYPSARLIRQRSGEPWALPIAEAARRLAAFTAVVARQTAG